MKLLVRYIANLFDNKKVILNLAINDTKARFASSALGVFWAFMQPMMTILVFWFVFQVGFKTSPIDDVEFIVWFVPAFLVWNYFSETLLQTTNSIIEYSYLVKKVNFNVSIIPPIKILSNGFVHIVFIFVICFIIMIYRYGLSIYSLQVIYYFVCLNLLLLGLGWFLSSLAVFVRDVSNIITVFIQIGFWATPVFWNPSDMNPIVQNVLKLNPMYYICNGYRESFIYKVGFWKHPVQTAYFWILVLLLLLIGVNTFNKLYKKFDDAL